MCIRDRYMGVTTFYENIITNIQTIKLIPPSDSSATGLWDVVSKADLDSPRTLGDDINPDQLWMVFQRLFSAESMKSRLDCGNYLKVELTYKPENENEASIVIQVRIKRVNFKRRSSILFEISDISQLRELSRLKELDKYKDTLLASVSHELRTPLNCIIPMLRECVLDPEVPETIREKFLCPAMNSSNLLLAVVNDMLDYSRIKRNKLRLNFEPLNVEDVLHEIAKIFSLQIQSKGIQFEIDISNTCLLYTSPSPRDS
eukprot:TRINITY_DN9214_c0_g1_i2.p1 TRINITY_DN9214_c0_g1~~TRINITY_DN9214_c0_g1_i2.p1  ORF type:complete len:259 (+),score=39.46 TRINITY_DN9214_c0_g1_i2:65-841(+)